MKIYHRAPTQKNFVGETQNRNVLFDDFKVQSLLDWEMATIGDPLCDLALGLTTDDVSSHGLNIEACRAISNDEAIRFGERSWVF